ncbi:MAG: hypothetical protein ABJA66_08415, partial [Actinomycetota bacterium]
RGRGINLGTLRTTLAFDGQKNEEKSADEEKIQVEPGETLPPGDDLSTDNTFNPQSENNARFYKA